MTYAFQWLRSLIFIILMYGAMLPVALAYLPWAIVSRQGAVAAAHAWCRFVLWLSSWLIGLRSEVRGTPPVGEVMVAAKHQSFLDIIIVYAALPHAKFIMKRELIWTPILGQYALRMGCIPVNRGRRGAAIKQMLADVTAGRADPGQLVIYPQGTRVAPGVQMPYKGGTGALYLELGQPCVPVAGNVGVFWPKRGIYRRPGLAVMEFLDPIAPGLSVPDFMGQLETAIEGRSNALMAEAGWRKGTSLMPNNDQVVAHFLDLMDRAGGTVTARKMFGEHAVYLGAKVVALLCDDRLFIKPTPGAVVLLPDAPEAPPYPGARPHLVADSAMDDPDLLLAILQAAADDLPAPKPKPARRAR